MAPRISVIIPTYNRFDLLDEALASVLAQSLQDYEVIVADDGSAADPSAPPLSLGGQAHYIRLPHSGKPGLVRNRAIAEARGEIIAFLDDDDLWRPHKLERHIELLESDTALGMVYSDLCLLRPDGSLSDPLLTPEQRQAEHVLDHLLEGCFIQASSIVVRRRLLEQTGLFDETLRTGEDYDLWLRLAATARAACIPEPLVCLRRVARSLSQQSELDNYRNAAYVLERARRTLALPLRRRLRCRRSLSRWHAHLGLLLAQAGELGAARRCLLRSLRWNPLQRRAWAALRQSYTGEAAR